MIYATASIPAHAKKISQTQKTGLITAIVSFETAMGKADYKTVINRSMPPALLNHIAAKFGMQGADSEKLKGLIIMQMSAAMQRVKMVSFGMDKKAIGYYEHSDGTFYALIPSHTIMEVKAKRFKASGQTLALMDGGKWYLLRVSEPRQVGMVRAVYPRFKSVEFKIGSMEVVK